MIKGTIAVLILAAVVVTGLLAYMGVFGPVAVKEATVGPYTYAYESVTGDYAKTGPVFERVKKALLKEGAKPSRGIGIYYDDPNVVAKQKLRSDCGAVIEEKDYPLLPRLLEKLTIRTTPAAKRLAVEFPLRNKFSYMIGPARAYPALMKYAKKKGHKVLLAIELYDTKSRRIFYMVETTR